MITDQFHTEDTAYEKSPLGVKLIAALAAIAVSAALLTGYFYLRKRHEQQTAAALPTQPATTPKGPARAQIMVDEPLLKGNQSLIGGAVKNISNERLNKLSVELELRRRKDGKPESMRVPINPNDLDPQQEGRYSLLLPAQDYAAVRLLALREGENSAQLSYSVLPGQKRPLERLDSKTIVVQKPGRRSEFINTPDNPSRVP
jgi:hypothetical protein